jgi:hypothetical protein
MGIMYQYANVNTTPVNGTLGSPAAVILVTAAHKQIPSLTSFKFHGEPLKSLPERPIQRV